MNKEFLLSFVIGIVFILVGYILLSRFWKKKKILSSEHVKLLEGVVVDCEYHAGDSDSSSTYFPIFELNINGNLITHVSKYGYSRDITGEKKLLYYDENTGMIFEKNSIKKDFFAGIMCLILGFIVVFVLLF